ncbi:MAG: carbohydrate ABC transporter permease [Clostridiaceae bacterium]|nr:carbohydrate ABC transporter permease [Eubacteriales bacterium]
MHAGRKRSAWSQTGAYATLIVASLIFMVPFIAMLFNAFKPEYEILGYPPTYFPKELTLDNFKAVIENDSMHLFSSLGNSIFVAATRTVLTLYLSALWGYALSKLRFPGRKVLFYLVLSAMMVPTAVILLPLYQEMIWMGLNGKLLSQIVVVNGTTSYAVFIMKQFIDTLPNDVIEAGRIDGCSEFQIFHRIVFPLLKNAVSAVAIIVFLYIWNDFLWPYMMIDDPSKYTVTVAMQFLNGRNFIRYGQLMAATAISILPIVIMYFIFQKRFTQGIAMTGVKE